MGKAGEAVCVRVIVLGLRRAVENVMRYVTGFV